MARIAGIDLPREKRIEIALTYIYGIGRTSANKILAEAGVNPDIRVKDLSEADEDKLRGVIAASYTVEGDLRRNVAMDIKRLTEIGCYRGLRHRKGLPVRGPFVFIEPAERKEEYHAPYRFIKEGRVYHLAVDQYGPGQVGWTAVSFAVEEVAPSADGLGQSYCRDETVQNVKRFNILPPRDHYNGEYAEYESAVYRQSAAPDVEHRPECCIIVKVEQDVIGSGSYDTDREHPEGYIQHVIAGEAVARSSPA